MPDDIRVAILGCGPAGMFAAHAVQEAGHEFTMLSKNRKSYMRGAQYLHRPIPGLSGSPFPVQYALKGTVEGYRDKVYGDMGDILVSPETLVGVSDAWDIREAYDRAWELYSDRIVDVELRGAGPTFLEELTREFDMVISTVPNPVLCRNPSEHQFLSQKVWVTDKLRTLGEFEFGTDGTMMDNLVVCSGDKNDWWYRQSRIHGWENTEFPHSRRPAKPWVGADGKPPYTVHEVEKPIRHTCTCFPEIVRMGRYGKWQKGVLSHESFYNTARALVAIEQGWVTA